MEMGNGQQAHVADHGAAIIFLLVQAKPLGARPRAKYSFHGKHVTGAIVVAGNGARDRVEGEAAMPTQRVRLPRPLFDIQRGVKELEAGHGDGLAHVPVAAAAVNVGKDLRHAGIAVGMVNGHAGPHRFPTS